METTNKTNLKVGLIFLFQLPACGGPEGGQPAEQDL